MNKFLAHFYAHHKSPTAKIYEIASNETAIIRNLKSSLVTHLIMQQE